MTKDPKKAPKKRDEEKSMRFFVSIRGRLKKEILAEMQEKGADKPQQVVLDALKRRYNLEFV